MAPVHASRGRFHGDRGEHRDLFRYAAECGAQVIAVEPVPHDAERVRENLRLNGYAGEVVQKAVADRPGCVRITADEDSYNHLVAEGGIEVAATTLDELLRN